MTEQDVTTGAESTPPLVVSAQKGFWIPIEIWRRTDLTAHERLLLADVYAMQSQGLVYFKSNARIAHDIGCSDATVKRSLANLRKLGLLKHGDAKQGNVRVLIVPALDHFDLGQNELASGSKRPKPKVKMNRKVAQIAPHNKSENKPVNKSDSNTEVLYPWDSDKFAETWRIWLDERKQRKTKKYTPRGEQTALHNLQNISQNNEQTAIDIIHQSIAQGWQGLFPIKSASGTKVQSDHQQLRNYIETGQY
jgi:hypothetical protein